MGKQSYTLAMYDIRGKQNFIFRKGKLQEVIGASDVIRDLFEDYLYPAANSVKYDPMGISADTTFQDDAIYRYNDKKRNDTDKIDTAFTWAKFRRHLEEGYLGELIYDGGGNFFVLYKDKATCAAVNRRFTKRVMEEVYSLKVLCSFVEVDPEKNNYKEDQTRLYQKNRENEANESVTIPSTVLPFTMIDRKTSMPIAGIMNVHNEQTELSKESQAKLKKFEKKRKDAADELILDNLVEEKGVSSLLAIIHIDGNNMGAMFYDALDHLESYEDCVKELRDLSSIVQKVHIDRRKKDIDRLLNDLNKEEKDRKKKHRRAVVSAGDDFTIICKAQDALKVTEEYLAGLWNDKKENITDKGGKPRQWSACAGIAVFHSHAPFSDAYRIAEECCDSAKAVMKEEGLSDAELIDFEYLQSGIDMSLNKIRNNGTKRIGSRPWVYRADDLSKDRLIQSDKMYTWVESMQGDAECAGRHLSLQKINEICRGIGHSNIKSLAGAALDGKTGFHLELERMAAHSRSTGSAGSKELLKEYEDFCDTGHEEAFRALIYDYVIFYDIWFFKKEELSAAAEEKARKEDRNR